MTRRSSVYLLALLPILGMGCSSDPAASGGASDAKVVVLQDVAEMLRANVQPNGRGPGKLADLNGSQAVFPNGHQAVKSGDVVVVWGGAVKGEAGATGGDVVAYEKDTPTSGGYVVLTSGEVKKMTADEFKAAPKAK